MSVTDDDFAVHVDADFAGNWVRAEAADDPNTAKSRHGYIVSWSGCPIMWASQLQTETALSSTESEFIGLSTALRAVIPIMELLRELKQQGVPVGETTPKVFCQAFEDNSGALEIANVPKMRPRTKTINVKYHHFHQYVDQGEIKISYIESEENPADMMTKPLPLDKLQKCRRKVLGWVAQLNHMARGSVKIGGQSGGKHHGGQASEAQLITQLAQQKFQKN